jgi:hypothetical protein
VSGDRGADLCRALGSGAAIEREPFRALAARDGETATWRWVLEL